MTWIPAWLRDQVEDRAGGRCEYCRLAQEGQEATFHVDHIVPESAAGPGTLDNLALACVSCSLRKLARQVSKDPKTNRTVRLFHPRRQRWADHFAWKGVEVVGLTATGRATLVALQMNRALILRIRLEEAERGRHPPTG